MKLVYIAGAFRASNSWDMEKNIRRAETLALKVWGLGVAVICPHTNTRFFHGTLPDRVWLDGDKEILRRCDAVLLTGGWELSSGAKAERALAIELDIPVYCETQMGEFMAWIHSEPPTPPAPGAAKGEE